MYNYAIHLKFKYTFIILNYYELYIKNLILTKTTIIKYVINLFVIFCYSYF